MSAVEEGLRLVGYFERMPEGYSTGVTAEEAREAVSHNPIIYNGLPRTIMATADGTGTYTLTSKRM